MIRTTPGGIEYEAKMDGSSRRIILVDGEERGALRETTIGWTGLVFGVDLVHFPTVAEAYEQIDTLIDAELASSAAPEPSADETEPKESESPPGARGHVHEPGHYGLKQLRDDLSGVLQGDDGYSLRWIEAETKELRQGGSHEAMQNRNLLGRVISALTDSTAEFATLVDHLDGVLEEESAS